MEFTKDDYPNTSTPLHPAFARPPLHIMPSATTFHFANNSDTINIPQKGLIGKCTTFAELPQILHKNASCLRNFRKYYTKLHSICGTSANITQKCILLAGEPQILNKNASYLRNFRKDYTKLHSICGTSANIAQKCILLAEIPQILHKNIFCLRNFRKWHAI
ncbi:hypothetical protein [Segatella oulorum]|uniref:hypothetical protein n=1 Tax=Segatella oulorum TaxID=28136 RepID=UPI0028E2FE7F|nr:hypothetical protein [Segatella oulorum]